jgi:hypothetical protein
LFVIHSGLNYTATLVAQALLLGPFRDRLRQFVAAPLAQRAERVLGCFLGFRL